MLTRMLTPLTVQRRPRRAAGQPRDGAGAPSQPSSSTQDAAGSSHASATRSSSSSPHGGRSVQLLLDLLQPGALLEAGHPVDHPGGHVRAGAGRAAVRVDGEDVGGAAEGADRHPAAVLGEAHVLDLGGGEETSR